MYSNPSDNWQGAPDLGKRLSKLSSSSGSSPPSSPPAHQWSLPNGRHGVGGWWGGGGGREGAEKRKLSPNCHIYKALPARHRFPLFNLTHTASCLLKPCKALWSSASWAERTPQPRERRVRGIDGETEKEKIACVRERWREKETILFVLWSKHAPGFMKGVKLWRLIEKWDKQRLWKAEGKIVAGSAGGPPLNLLQTVQPW